MDVPCDTCKVINCSECLIISDAVDILKVKIQALENDLDNRLPYTIGIRRYYKRRVRYMYMKLRELQCIIEEKGG